ncbi:MAG: o-succinylbenzoate synthase, partial [Aggregatilineales bacterium]
LHAVAIPFAEALKTSFGVEPFKAAVLVEVITEEGGIGWGEASVETRPGYAGETMGTGYHILKNFLVPKVVGQTISDPTDVPGLIAQVRDNRHAKHGLEAAVWDAFAKANDMRLTDLLASYLPADHASRNVADVGVSIGIQDGLDASLEVVNRRLSQGYKRIKLKIKPGWDIELAKTVREAHPDILLMLDANSAYSLADAEHLKKFDDYNLLMIEQPLSYDDIYEHSKLQPQLKTRICLDESVKSAGDLRLALDTGAIGILNLKPARVGGFTECLEIYRICVEHDLPLWIGGMMETGVGRAANVALASLPGINLPCDISATDRYFHKGNDVSMPPFKLNDDSQIAVPDGMGIGVEVQRDRLEKAVALWNKHNLYGLD